jgi:hypothetical protein
MISEAGLMPEIIRSTTLFVMCNTTRTTTILSSKKSLIILYAILPSIKQYSFKAKYVSKFTPS